jgi:DNA polymerase elongation subunit (family B)
VKVLLLDIETAPNVAHVWGLFDQNVGINQIQAAGYTLSWAAKWLGEKEVMFDSVYQTSPKRMIRRIHKLVSEADVVIHYNGTKFDMPTLNKEFILQELPPPAPYKQIDLLRTARSQFRFPSNKLDYIAKALGLGTKVKHVGHDLWTQCMARDPEAWAKMEAYNRHDVVLLEKLYYRLRPWIRSHPSFGAYDDTDAPCCPSCGSFKLQRRGKARTIANVYVRLQCTDCGTWSREAFSERDRVGRERLVRQI